MPINGRRGSSNSVDRRLARRAAARHATMNSGRPITAPTKRPTDRAPHMGRYVRAGKMFGHHGAHIVVENQLFFLPTGDENGDDGDPKRRATWTRDMLCIALDRLVEIEIERRKRQSVTGQ